MLILGTPSAAVPDDQPPLSLKLFITFLKTIVNNVYSEIVDMGKLLDDEAKDLNWTMYRLGMLSNGKGVTRAAPAVGSGDWVNATHRPGTAVWILDQLESEQSEWTRQKPSLFSLAK